jgi:dephospho-CoA kinase
VKGTPGHLPPIVLTGAPGAGKQTVAKLLTELAGYTLVTLDDTLCGSRYVFILDGGTQTVAYLREHGFRVVWVYAPPSYRGQRLLAAGRMQPGEDVPEEDPSTVSAEHDHVLTNVGSEDDLRHDVAELLNRMAS